LQHGYDSRDGFNYYKLPDYHGRRHTNADYPGRWVFRANRLSGSAHVFLFLLLNMEYLLTQCVLSYDARVMHWTCYDVFVLCIYVRLSASLSRLMWYHVRLIKPLST